MKFIDLINKNKKEKIFRERIGKLCIEYIGSVVTIRIYMKGKNWTEDIETFTVLSGDTIELDDAS